MADPKIKYDIEAAVTGEASVQQLEGVLRELEGTLEGDLQKSAKAAADALAMLGAKRDAIDSFQTLKRETASLGSEMDAAARKVDSLGAQLPQTSAATAQFAEAEIRARTALAGAKADLDESRQALVKLRDEYTGAARKSDDYRESSAQLQVTVRSLRDNLKEKRQELSTAADATRQAQVAEKSLTTEYNNAVNAARNVSTTLGAKNRALAESRDAMQAVGIATTNLTEAERNLDAAVVTVRQDVAALAPAYRAAAQASSESTQRQVANQAALRDGMGALSRQLAQIQNIATAAVGGTFIGGLAKDVLQTADEYKNLAARIKLATGEGQAFDAAFAGVAQVALRTNSALDETGTLFARIAKAGQEAGLGADAAQRQALGLTETINQAIQLSGSSSEASSAAITQLIQGLQSGVLRGEEFNSVMEQAPRLAQALANGLNVTTGELRKMANEGQLTTATVIKALQGQSTAVAAEFDKLPPTVGRALQNLKTQWTLYIGESDRGAISSANVARIISGLSNNLDTLVSTLYAAGKAYAAIKIAGLATDAVKWAAATMGAAKATADSTVAVGAHTVAVEANTVAQAANTRVAAAGVVAASAGAAAQRVNAAAWSDVAKFTTAGTAAQAGANAATAAGAAAQAAAGARVAETAGQVARAGIVWRGFTALFGPLGIALAVLGPEIAGLAQKAGEAAAKFMGWGKVLKDAEDSLRAQTLAEQEAIDSKLRMAAAAEEARNRQFALTKEATGLISKFDEMRTKGDSASEALGKIGKDFDLSNAQGFRNAAGVLDRLLADAKLTASEFQAAWAKALDGRDLVQFETTARAALANTARGAEQLQQVMEAGLREAVRRTGLEFTQLQGGIGAASRSAVNDIEVIVAGLGRLKAEGVDTGRLLSTSISKAIDTADSQRAIEVLRAQIEGLRAQLGDKVTDGLLDQVAQKALVLKDSLDAAMPGLNSVREAYRQLGITAPEELNRIAKANAQAWALIRDDGTSSADTLRIAFSTYADSAIAASGQLGGATRESTQAMLEQQAAARGLSIAFDASGRATVQQIGTTNDDTSTRQRNVSAIDAQTAALQRLAAVPPPRTADGFGANKDGSAAGTFTNNLPVDTLFAMLDKFKAGNLSAGDLESAQTALQQARANQEQVQMMSKLAPGAVSTAAITQGNQLLLAATQILERVQALQTPGGAPTPAPAPASAKTYTYNLQINGSNFGAVNTDEAGGRALENFLRSLEQSKRSAGL